MPRSTEDEIERNMRALAHAIAQQELEGLKVPEETVAELQRVARGEIDTDEVRRRLQARLEQQLAKEKHGGGQEDQSR